MNKPQSPGANSRPVPMVRGDIPEGMWSDKVTFRHGHCDPAGIVYTPKFFDIFNQVIEAWFGSRLGISYYDIIGPRRTGLGYVSAASVFFTPCMMGETVEVFVEVAAIGTKSARLILHALKEDHEALRGDFTIVATSLESHTSMPLPDDIRAALAAYRDQTGSVPAGRDK